MAKVYIITGNTGAGKSTYSKKLAIKENAYILAGDEWFKTLFLADTPTPSTYEWALERTQRIETQMLNESLKLLDKDISVILDIGFFKKEQRLKVKSFFEDNSRSVTTHYLDVSKEVRWQRVTERNTKKTDTFQFEVSKEVFEFCEELFEPLDSAEIENAILI